MKQVKKTWKNCLGVKSFDPSSIEISFPYENQDKETLISQTQQGPLEDIMGIDNSLLPVYREADPPNNYINYFTVVTRERYINGVNHTKR